MISVHFQIVAILMCHLNGIFSETCDLVNVSRLTESCMVPTVMESHGILASHGKSWKMERVVEKSWIFNHLFLGKNS